MVRVFVLLSRVPIDRHGDRVRADLDRQVVQPIKAATVGNRKSIMAMITFSMEIIEYAAFDVYRHPRYVSESHVGAILFCSTIVVYVDTLRRWRDALSKLSNVGRVFVCSG